MLSYRKRIWVERYCKLFLLHMRYYTDLSQRAHTLDEVTYSNYLRDGQVIGTLNKTEVRVRIIDDEIYFNNAKVIEANVLTNNGLIHMYVTFNSSRQVC
jgi:uncharacterized surface protein with fasciclin (FAS1) repeats